MLRADEISERNGLLVGFIKALDLGIHIIQLTDKPKLISPDYNYWFSGYIKNFNLILTDSEHNPKILWNIRLKPVQNMDMEDLKPKILQWMTKFQHKKIYTLSLKNSKLFVVGFNHHNRMDHANPFPVFAFFYPLIYMSREKALEVQKRFKEYDLIIK